MDTDTPEVKQLLSIIGNIAAGKYSNDIMPLTTDSTPEAIRTIAEAMGMMMVKVEAREYKLELLIEELRRLNERIRENSLKTVAAMAQALEARDAYTRGHAERVAEIAAAIAREMGLEEEEINLIRTAGVLHDIGKIGCSDRIFQTHEAKNPPDVVKEIIAHPGVGAEILKNLDFLGGVTEIIHSHHERIDGKGYPRSLASGDIPLGARIIAVADSFDAMTTDRPYQKAMPRETAMEILRKHAGTKWDAECVAAFERLPEQRGE
jgi:putative nucleotidyltransferase with HDIG domain